MKEEYTCHVCGYPELPQAPWGEDGKTGSQNICPCCGVQFGYEDITIEAIELYRCNWINDGAEWLRDSAKPKDWDLAKQLSRINVRLDDFKV